MNANSEEPSPTRSALKWCAILITIYLIAVLVLPEKSQTIFNYHFTTFGYRVSEVIIAIPAVIVWVVAFWGYSTLFGYAKSLGESKEAKPYNSLAKGLGWLAWSLPISAIINRVLASNNAVHGAFHSAEIIISNYIYLIIPLVAFVLVWGAVKGVVSTRPNPNNFNFSSILILLFILFGIIYCYLLLKTFDLNSLGSTKNPYHLPAWLMILTIIIPYLYAWFIGLLAAIELNLYSSKMQGIIYKRALSYLSYGLSLVIVGFVAIQYVSTARPAYGSIVFNIHTLLGLIFRVIVGLGFIAMAVGANKLKRIEEV